MKRTYKSAFRLAAAVIIGTVCLSGEAKSFSLFDQTFSIKKQEKIIISQNNVGNETGMWDKTKDGTEKAWDKTKDVSADVWDATKDGTEKAWDKTKDVSADIWDATKDGTEKAADAVTGGK